MSVKELLEKAERCIRPPTSFCEKAHGFLSQALVTLENQPDLEALNKQLLEACKVSKNALNGCVRFLLGTGPQPTPEEMSEAVLVIDAAIKAVDKILGGK